MPGYTYTLGGERGKLSRQRTRMPLARDFSQEESQANLYILSTEEWTLPSIVNWGCCVSFFSSCVSYGISLSLTIIHNALMDLTM